MVTREQLVEARNKLLSHIPKVGAPVYGIDGRRAASIVVDKDGTARYVYPVKGRDFEDQTDEHLDTQGVKGGGNDYLNLVGKDRTKAYRC